MRQPERSNFHIVRPLGRFGRTYRLNNGQFRFYRAHTICAWILISFFCFIYLAFPSGDIWLINWPNDLPLALASASAGLCLFGQMAIASRGAVIDDAEASATRFGFALKRSHYGAVLVICLVVSLVALGGMYYEYASRRPIGTLETIVLVTSIFGAVQTISKLRTKA